MSSNEGHPTGPDAQDQYEATVLDFLDKEMAAAQPVQEAKQQSSELDALVSDLLKQVITEAEQPQEANNLLFDSEDELFSGMSSEQQKSPFSLGEAALAPPLAAAPVQAETDVPTTAPAAPAPAASDHAPTLPIEEPMRPGSDSIKELLRKRPSRAFHMSALLESALTAKGKLPVKAIACAAVLVAIAGAIYFFSGLSKEATKSAPPAAVSQPAETQPAPTSQTVVATIPEASIGNGAAAKRVPVPALKVQPKPAPRPVTGAARTATGATPVPQPAAKTMNSAEAEEQQASAQVEAVSAPSEKPAPRLVQDNAASPQALPERKLDLSRLVEPLVAQNTTPAPKPAAAASAARNLVAAVPLSQASPVYPELALRTRTSASVVLKLQIDEQGKVSKATPVNGPPIFHSAAVAAALQWRYKPASIGGVNVSSQATVTMVFKLNK